MTTISTSSPRTEAAFRVPGHPDEGASIELMDAALELFSFPDGTYWQKRARGEEPDHVDTES